MTRPTWNVSCTLCLVLGTLTFLSQDTKVLSTNVLSTLIFMHRITLIPGDGIGPEVASAVVRIIDASGVEIEIIPGVVESLKIITEKASTRISHFAFDYVLRENRKKITCVHKANIMKLSDGLFLRCFHKVGDTHPQIEAQDMIVDNAS